ncbi:MAG: HlyD family efflux transporter periplasmic adaptor subunit [Thermoanaerobaculia bacterium]
MTAGALAMRPCLRSDLTMIRRETRGQVDWIVKDPSQGKYSRFGEVEIGLMRLMDGTRTPPEIAESAAETIGIDVDAGAIADFAQKLKRLGIVERTPAEQHLMLLERLRAVRTRRAGRKSRGSLLRIRFPAADPDRAFQRWEPFLQWMWSPAFAWGCAALFLAYLAILYVRGPEFWAGFRDFYTGSNVSAWDYLLAYGLMLSVIVVHELGHGLTTKHFGGEVHEMGAMLIYFMPALYCNTNDAWLFERRSHRLWVTFAGPWIQLLIASIAGITWLFMEPGSLGFRVAFLIVVLAGLMNIVTNLNPLIPLDGYYALSDYLEIPNLRRRAFDYCQAVLRRRVLGLEVAVPAVTPRERRVFLIYGTLAFFYSIFAIVIALLWFTMIFRRLFGPWAWLLIGFLVGRILWPRLVRLRSMAKSAATTMRGRWGRSRRVTRIALIAGAALLAVLVLPWTYRAEAPFRVAASRQLAVHIGVPGVLDRVLVDEGDTVGPGQPLAVLWNPDLEIEVLDARRRVEILRAREALGAALEDPGAVATATDALAEASEELALLEARRGRLVVRAPIAGIVLGHDLAQRVGEAVAEGDSLLTLASARGRIARVMVPLVEAGDLARGQPVHARISTWPGHTFAGRVRNVAPAARHGWVDVDVPLPEDHHAPVPGMTGVAKIVTGRGIIGQALAQSLRRNVRLDFLL